MGLILSLWFRLPAPGVSSLGTIFFALALWTASLRRDVLAIGPAQAALALIGQFGATIVLALESLAARRERRSTWPVAELIGRERHVRDQSTSGQLPGAWQLLVRCDMLSELIRQ